VVEDVTTLNVNFMVTDDIEIEKVEVLLDGTEIKEYTDFVDYRRALADFDYENLTNGEHTLTVTATDISGKSTTKSVDFEKVEPYRPVYEGEIFYAPFDGDYMELITITQPTVVGSPGFADGQEMRAYDGASGAYLTYPAGDINPEQFSAVFWYKLDADPNRAGLLVMGPPDPNLPATPNNRTAGFRLFREAGGGGLQIVKLNIGTGSSDSWFDGGATAGIDPASTDWVHIAFTISDNEATVYLDGEVVSTGTFDGIDWTGTDVLSVASGAPRFTEWGHLSDKSLFDELRLFNRALTQQEIQDIIAAES
jgi:hypothetical protein